MTYGDLRKRTTKEFLKWGCTFSEVWSYTIRSHYHSIRMNEFHCTHYFEPEEECYPAIYFNHFMQQVIDGWNNEYGCILSSIVSSREGVIVFFVKKGLEPVKFTLDNYQSQNGYTKQDMARWDALLTVWEME